MSIIRDHLAKHKKWKQSEPVMSEIPDRADPYFLAERLGATINEREGSFLIIGKTPDTPDGAWCEMAEISVEAAERLYQFLKFYYSKEAGVLLTDGSASECTCESNHEQVCACQDNTFKQIIAGLDLLLDVGSNTVRGMPGFKAYKEAVQDALEVVQAIRTGVFEAKDVKETKTIDPSMTTSERMEVDTNKS